jgi:spermidine/putrescine-binding protein
MISRRRFIQTGFAGLGAITGGGLLSGGLLAGCGADDETAAIKFFNWQDYIEPSVLTDFTTRTKRPVSYSTYASNDELADRLALAGVRRRGNRKRTSFDLVVPSDNLFRTLKDQGELQAIDSAVVTSALMANLGPAFRTLDFDPGNRYCIPWATGTTGIGYDTRIFPEPPNWNVFADATHAGKMTVLNETREALAAALFALSLDPNSTDPKDITAAEAVLSRMKASTAFNSATYLAGLETGRIVAAQAFNTDIAQAKRKNPNLAFTIPEAGGISWTDVLCIPKDAPNPEGANAFIAFMLDPKISAANAATLGANTGNQAAQTFIPPAVLNDELAFPTAEVAKRLSFLKTLDEPTSALYEDAWARVTAS